MILLPSDNADQDSLKIPAVSSCDRVCLLKDWCVASRRHMSESQLMIKGSHTVSHLVIAADPLRLQTRHIFTGCVLTTLSCWLTYSLCLSWKKTASWCGCQYQQGRGQRWSSFSCQGRTKKSFLYLKSRCIPDLRASYFLCQRKITSSLTTPARSSANSPSQSSLCGVMDKELSRKRKQQLGWSSVWLFNRLRELWDAECRLCKVLWLWECWKLS